MMVKADIFSNPVEFSVCDWWKNFKNFLSFFRMAFHYVEFLWSKFSRFVENSLRNVDLADVMEKGCVAEHVYLVVRKIRKVMSCFLKLTGYDSNIGLGMKDVVSGKHVMAVEDF